MGCRASNPARRREAGSFPAGLGGRSFPAFGKGRFPRIHLPVHIFFPFNGISQPNVFVRDEAGYHPPATSISDQSAGILVTGWSL